jgi:hypothetical protein
LSYGSIGLRQTANFGKPASKTSCRIFNASVDHILTAVCAEKPKAADKTYRRVPAFIKKHGL